MKGLSLSKGQFFSYVTAVLLSVFFVVVGVFGASTVGPNISTGGTLTVDGASTLTGNVAMSGTLKVTGALYASSTGLVDGNFIVGQTATVTASTGDLAVKGSLSASSTLVVTGASFLYGNANFNGNATVTASTGDLAVKGSLSASSTLVITGISSLYGDVRVNGFATTSSATGNILTNGSVGIASTSPTTALGVTGTTTTSAGIRIGGTGSAINHMVFGFCMIPDTTTVSTTSISATCTPSATSLGVEPSHRIFVSATGTFANRFVITGASSTAVDVIQVTIINVDSSGGNRTTGVVGLNFMGLK